MNQNETIAFAATFIVGIFVLFPSLLYMFDKINHHSDEKRNFVSLWLVWPLAPFIYYRVWKGQRDTCRAFPMILWGVTILGVFGAGTIFTLFDLIKN